MGTGGHIGGGVAAVGRAAHLADGLDGCAQVLVQLLTRQHFLDTSPFGTFGFLFGRGSFAEDASRRFGFDTFSRVAGGNLS